MHDQKLVSIILPAFNAEQYISDAIDSILNQTYISWELIIIYDKSSDQTLDIINDYIKKDSRISLVYNPAKGLISALNHGIKISKGDFIARMDADDISMSDRIELQIKHMILNNLDPAVAQFPQELITYGGNGAVFNNWAQFYITFKMMGHMQPGQTLSMHSGHPAGLWPVDNDQMPSAVITNGMMIPFYSTPDGLDRTTALGVSMYGQMTAGSWMYIGPQGIVHGTTLTCASAIEIQAKMTGNPNNDPKGKIFVTSGLGGMSGAQAKAGTITGVVCIMAEVDVDCLDKRHSQGWLNEKFTDLDALFNRALAAQAAGEAVSLGFHFRLFSWVEATVF